MNPACIAPLLVLLTLSPVFGDSSSTKAPRSAPPGLEIIMSGARPVLDDSLGSIDLDLLFVNHTDSSIEFALVAVQPYGKGRKEIRINPRSTQEKGQSLPYRTANGHATVRQFDPPLAGGDSVTWNLCLPVSRTALRSMASVGLQASGWGGIRYAVTLLSSPLIPPEQRLELAVTVSARTGKRFGFITDGGSWTYPPRLDSLAPASDQEQHPEYGQLLEMQSIPGDSVEIEIVNAADRTVTVSILGHDSTRIIPVCSKLRKRIRVWEGTYSFTGTASACLPCSGIYTWGNSYRYTWKFWIE